MTDDKGCAECTHWGNGNCADGCFEPVAAPPLDDSRPTDDDRNSVECVMDIANTSDLPQWALTQLRGAAATAIFAERMRERGRWLKALDDSSLPHTYRRMLVVLALGRCDNCDGDPARCDCDDA